MIYNPAYNVKRKRIMIISSLVIVSGAVFLLNSSHSIYPTAAAVIAVSSAVLLFSLAGIAIYYYKLRAEKIDAVDLYDSLFNNSYDGIYIINNEGVIENVNQGFLNMMGCEKDELIGRNINNFVIDTDLYIMEIAEENLRSKGSFRCDLNYLDKLGIYHSALVRMTKVSRKGGAFGYQAIVTDITERKAVETALRNSEARYKALLSAIPDLVLKFDRSGTLLDFHMQRNGGSALLPELDINSKIEKIFPEGIAEGFMDSMEKAFAKKELQLFEFHIKAGNRYIEEEARIVPMENNQSIAIIRDITARKNEQLQIQNYINELVQSQKILEESSKEMTLLNSKLEQSNAKKDKFFSIVAHDLRSPFTGLLGFSEVLANDIEKLSPDEIRSFAFHMNTSVKSIFKLLENLLDWARIKTGNFKFSPEAFDLNGIIKEVVELYSINSSKKSIDISMNLGTDIKVVADIHMIDIVLRNLISNAIKYTHRGGKITIESEKTGRDVKVIVTDSGVGMHDEKLNSLFKIESIKSTEGTGKEKGTGLGLILCKEFVDKHGGKISVESAVNAGTKFSFTLPAA